MKSTSLKKWQDQYICDWFDGLGENYIKELQAEVGVDITPKKAWLAVFGAGAKPMPNKKLPISTRVTRLSPVPAQESQGDCVAAPAEAVQGQGTITCAACNSANTESCCHPAEFCQAICIDCNTSLNADGSVWQEKVAPTLEQFQRWLENKAHSAHAEYFNGPQGETLSQEIERCRPFADLIARTRIVTEQLMQFKLEQGA